MDHHLCGENGRWLWRRRGKKDDAIFVHTKKFPNKIMVFGGISYNYRTPLIAMEGTIDANRYVDDCIDGSGLIIGMNEAYGVGQWKLMQDGAAIHTCTSTMDYLKLMCNVLPNWPANSPYLNPIENLWSIMKERVQELEPDTIENLIEIVFQVWETIEEKTIKNLIDSMPDRLARVIALNGAPNGY
ncbi:Transposable element Tcb1 transposase [Histomonas meleagridis]|uniref:Transposable element Tcb1 transposase n=1 Tax=Histomonas meleagridis TaxID=135588 RepID=UPI003559876C|nr:Transposable element Tcb1 transposase [Histomonas meleagridis]KAH0800827.1 Transposable element Tcb1 transposase [Histomonas meleagridis]